MIKRLFLCAFLILLFSFQVSSADVVEIEGVKFPTEKVIAGKNLKLNGVSILKKFGVVKVYAAGLYLEKITKDPEKIISSEQVKYMFTQYLTNKATSNKIRNGFINLITSCNTVEVVASQQKEIDQFTSWLDSDMEPGLTSETIYVPGKGLTLIYQDKVKGTIPGSTFAQMYFRYNVGSDANSVLREGLLGL